MRLEWDKIGEHFMELGTDHGVLYVQAPDKDPVKDDMKYHYGKGVVWNGLTSVTLSPEGAEPQDIYADNIKYATIRSAETFGATIEAYTFPEEFYECDGSAIVAKGLVLHGQKRNQFGFSYRSRVINDTNPDSDDSYKLHLIYGATASPSEQTHETINDSPDPGTLSWEIATTPIAVKGFKPTAHIEILSRNYPASVMQAIEDILYGSETTEARMPLPDELIEILSLPEGVLATRPSVPKDGAEFYGKTAADLQENIKINEIDMENVAVSGKLKKVTSYTEFGSEGNSEGHYLAINFDSPKDTTLEVIGVKHTEPKAITDGYLVFRVDDVTKPFKIRVTSDESVVTKTYDLNGLELEDKEN